MVFTLDVHFHLPDSLGKVALWSVGAMLGLAGLVALLGGEPPEPDPIGGTIYPPGGWFGTLDAYGRPLLSDEAGNAVLPDAQGRPVFMDASGRILFTGTGYLHDEAGDYVGDADGNVIPLDANGYVVTHDENGNLVRVDSSGRLVSYV